MGKAENRGVTPVDEARQRNSQITYSDCSDGNTAEVAVMSYEVSYGNLPIGYSASAARADEQVNVIYREFVSSEDGEQLILRLEGLPTDALAMLPPEANLAAENVEHLLSIIRPDKSATIYVNELRWFLDVQAKRSFESGEPVTGEDIADVRRMSFDGVTIPENAGVMFVFSIGWRKGFFYDLGPLHPARKLREYDIEVLLGQYYAYLSFQHLLGLSDEIWEGLLSKGWFPFIVLWVDTLKNMASHVKNGWDVDELLERIAEEVRTAAPEMKRRWEENSLFQDHAPVLAQAFERYLAGDFISATSILYPRIEGLMRSYHQASSAGGNASSRRLAELSTSTVPEDRRSASLLLPERFRRYLDDVYFAKFEPSSPEVVSRHSVAHGVAPADKFDLKAATIGLLTLEQLAFYLPGGTSLVIASRS